MLGQNWVKFSKEAKWMWKWLPLTETVDTSLLLIPAKCSSSKIVIAHLSDKITSEYLHLYQMLTRSWYWISILESSYRERSFKIAVKCSLTLRCLPTSLRYPTLLIETCCQVRKYHKITIFWKVREYVEQTITISITLSQIAQINHAS